MATVVSLNGGDSMMWLSYYAKVGHTPPHQAHKGSSRDPDDPQLRPPFSKLGNVKVSQPTGIQKKHNYTVKPQLTAKVT